MSQSVWVSLQFVAMVYVVVFVVALFVAAMIIVVRRALAPREAATSAVERQKERG